MAGATVVSCQTFGEVDGSCSEADKDLWGARFGMLKDSYGIPWMLNCTLEQK